MAHRILALVQRILVMPSVMVVAVSVIVYVVLLELLPFFFSSRRRHTRCSRDWSSDVCSSDLAHAAVRHERAHGDAEGTGPGARRRSARRVERAIHFPRRRRASLPRGTGESRGGGPRSHGGGGHVHRSFGA